jgi:Ca2+-transporting ATPase
MRSLSEIQQLSGWSEAGLSAESVLQSRKQFGANRLTPLPREPLWRKFLEKFDEPIIKILLAAALLSMFVELFQGNPVVAGIAIGIVAAVIVGVLLCRWSSAIPSLLFGSAVILFFVGWIVPPHHPSVEGLAVMIAVILATGVAFLSEYKSDREFEALNTHKDDQRVKVQRAGEVHTLPLEEVVVGDVVLLETGDEVPADGRLARATDLYVDQSLMTGESEPVHKLALPHDSAEGPEQAGCLYRGTQVVDGVGQMIVTEVGDATYLGQIAKRLSAQEEEDDEEGAAKPETEENRVKRKLTIAKDLTPLQLKLKDLADLISNVGYIAAGLIFLALLVRGFLVGEVRLSLEPSALFASSRALLNYFVYMVIVIVVAVPEGLPMSVTISLALAMQKMTRANSLVRQLVACETIGSATVICSDKTGTMTQNRMQVVRLFWGGTAMDRGTSDWTSPRKEPDWPNDGKPLEWLAMIAAVDSTAYLEVKQGKRVTVGNSTEGALLQWLDESGLSYEKVRLQFPPLYQIHFSSDRKRMTTVIRQGDTLIALTKGAPEWLLANSTHYQSADGTVKEWTEPAKEAAQDWVRDSASQAMRTLAFGYAVLPPETPTDEESLHGQREAIESNLVFVGMAAIRDPLRDDVKEAIQRCRDAGIEVKMITGDSVETARAIAYDIGLIQRRDAPIDTDDAVIYTSPRFNELHAELKALKDRDDLSPSEIQKRDALSDRLAGLRVLARARPLDKYKMVELLQDRQQVVAVTGDGTNDAPALKKADVGLAMGIAGTEVAKEASKIVLLDDSFATIVKAVHWGRSLYENIQRFIQFQLTINVSALTIAFLGPFFGVRPPFTVLQLLWINVIMDTFASIALCSEPPREGVMKQKPKRKDESILTRPMLVTIFSTAAFFVVVMLTLLIGMEHFHWFASGSGPTPNDWEFAPLKVRQVSIFFTIYIFFQIWNEINCRSLVPQVSGFHRLTDNPIFLAIVGITAAVQLLIISVPFIGAVFKVEPLGIVDWLVILVGTASVLLFAEVVRQIRLASVRMTLSKIVSIPSTTPGSSHGG